MSERFILTKRFMVLVVLIALSACGKAEFAGNTDRVPDTAVPVLSTGTDIYIEIGQEFSNEIKGKVEITNVQLFGSASWPGSSSLQLELRASLTGNASPGNSILLAAQPASWAMAVPIVNLTIPANSASFDIASANLKDSAAQF